jgi:hypothetical protein
MIRLLVAAYLAGSAGAAGAALLPNPSGLPCLIHCMVEATGREPTCRYTPSNCGEKLRNGLCVSPSEPGGKSVTIIKPLDPLTGYDPTPSPAFVRALARDIAASCSVPNVRCASFLGSQALYEEGDITTNPSLRFRETPERFSSINSCFQPNFESTVAISLARFCASGSPGTTWISILVPTQRSNPANQTLALGSSSSPNSPTCRGSNTVCSARFSAVSRAVSLLSPAIRSLDTLRSSAQWSSLTSAVFTITNVERTPPRRLASNTQLAIVPKSDAAASDISEKGHIRIPDWFYIGGIILVLVAGAIALWDQTKTLIRKARHRPGDGS